jgi:hypothetical protein
MCRSGGHPSTATSAQGSGWTGSTGCRCVMAMGIGALTVDPTNSSSIRSATPARCGAVTDWLDASRSGPLARCCWTCIPRARSTRSPTAKGRTRSRLPAMVRQRQLHHQAQPRFGNLWIQGGPRARMFFTDAPERAPALNKMPLVRWHRSYAYVSSTHMLLPRGLNLVYDEWGGEKASGLPAARQVPGHLSRQGRRGAESASIMPTATNTRPIKAGLNDQPDLWCKWSREIHQLATA